MKVAPCIRLLCRLVCLCIKSSTVNVQSDSQPSRVVYCWFSGGKIYITTQHPIRALFSSLKSRRVEWGGNKSFQNPFIN